MTYTSTQINAVARRIFTATSDVQTRWGFKYGTMPTNAQLNYPLNDWNAARPVVKRFFRRWASRALRIA